MKSLDQIAIEMNSHYRKLATQKWVQYTTGIDLGVNEAQHKLNEFKKSTQAFKVICDTLEKPTTLLELRY